MSGHPKRVSSPPLSQALRMPRTPVPLPLPLPHTRPNGVPTLALHRESVANSAGDKSLFETTTLQPIVEVDEPKLKTVYAPKGLSKSARLPTTPRPSENLVALRRSSRELKSIGHSPLRYSQSEASFAEYLRGGKERRSSAPTRRDNTESASPRATDALRRQQSDSSTYQVSPQFGRLADHPAPFYLLQQVFHSPGGGIATRSNLGIFSSKRAAQRAAEHFHEENKETLEHCDHMRLETVEMTLDKQPTIHQANEQVVL